MSITVQLGPRQGALPGVVYRWDPDTDILSAQLRPPPAAKGTSGSVEVEGADGSWIILDVLGECISGIEIAVWPDVTRRASLTPPPKPKEAQVRLPAEPAAESVTSLEVEMPMMAESDVQERIFHFRLGSPSESSAVRVARDLLLEVDGANHVAGLWLLNVPPFPKDP